MVLGFDEDEEKRQGYEALFEWGSIVEVGLVRWGVSDGGSVEWLVEQ